ncbi:Piwi-domain-containing protein [Rhizophagus irregularis]|uniref:Piwi-domain-containing protein n=1 Tax=Rhizophagus irregularis TaxID=588596 RepID=A0A2I1H8B5_9GLOM|nr:Piwi-domain-containing protein [Rhizophagus irregularis]
MKRPGFESEPIKVRTNFFEVTKLPKMNITHYDVTISPEVSSRLSRKVFNNFLEENQEALGGVKPVFDGTANMFTHKQLSFENKSFEVNYLVKLEKGRTFKITIKKARDIDMEDLFQFLNAKGNMTNNCEMVINAMNIIIRHEISAKHPIVDNSFYTPRGATSLHEGIEAWQGYYQSAHPTRGKMMINIVLSATTFYKAGPLIQLVAKILDLRSPNDLCEGLSDMECQIVEKNIKNLRINDNHRPEYRQKFRIEKLTQTSASDIMLEANGNKINVETYFQNIYNRRLLYPFLPCVIVRKNNYLPIEVCDIVPKQRYMRKLNEIQTADLIKFARQNPTIWENRIQTGLNILNYRNNEYLKQFGMEVSNNMAVVNARILPTPTIQYHKSSKKDHVQPNGGSWNLRDKKVINGATLSSWSVLAFLSYKDLSDQVIKFFVRELITTCQDTGMNISERDPPICRENPIGDTEESLKKAWLKAKSKARGVKPQLILCILPNTGSDLYAKIKRVSDTVIGVATQCVQSVHMKNPKKQYCANVCLKMNVKLGGDNSFLIPGHIQFLEDEPTILIGAAVTHLSPGDTKSPSYAALCGSLNAKASRYAASLRVQRGSTEIIAELANMVKELFKIFYQNCGVKPKKILFYRNGISESQFMDVLNSELTAIKDACQSLEADYRPTITFVVIQKRHHTRFFPIEKKNADKSGNCLPGTVVDMDITHPFEFDFYLLSHAGLHGTSRPTYYQVLYDENGFDANRLQTLSYNLCHIYARCTRAVSLVPPVYYARLAAKRARLYSFCNADTESSEGGKNVARLCTLYNNIV